MAKIIYEKREFKDRNTGVITEYDYIAIAGTDDKSQKYEVQLKNLVQSEKMVLLMISDFENGSGSEVVQRKATNDEKPTVTKTKQKNILDDDDEDKKSWFGN